MKTKRFNFLIMFLICIITYSCGPSDSEVIKLASPNNIYVFDIQIKKRGGSKEYNESRVSIFTVYTRHVESRMLFGYVSECPEEHCWHDFEVEETKEYLIGKNKWDEWVIKSQRTIDKKDIREFWRPESQSMNDFYKDIR